MGKKYTFDDLAVNREAYAKNFDRMLAVAPKPKTPGNPDHDRCVLIEQKLYQEQKEIMKSLGILAKDPCPINDNILCKDCSGFYKKKKRTIRKTTLTPKTKKQKKFAYNYVRCSPIAKDAVQCWLKNAATSDICKRVAGAISV